MNFSQSSVSEIISHSALVLGRSVCGFMPVKVGFMGVILSLRIYFFFVFATKESQFPYCPSQMLRRDMGRFSCSLTEAVASVVSLRESNTFKGDMDVTVGPRT